MDGSKFRLPEGVLGKEEYDQERWNDWPEVTTEAGALDCQNGDRQVGQRGGGGETQQENDDRGSEE